MLKYLCIILLCFVSVNCQLWASRACLVNGNNFYANIIQEVIKRIEKDIKWCNFKLIDVNREIDERLFKWHAKGTANYTNGFLVNLQKIDVTNIENRFFTRSSSGENVLNSQGLIHFRNFNIGYDVDANIEGSGAHRFTGTFMFKLVSIQCLIVRNLNTNTTTVSTLMSTSSAESRRMEYLPSNSISEMLSRHFSVHDITNSFSQWADLIEPIALDVASKAVIPEIRFDNRC